MERRRYLATVPTVALAGCTELVWGSSGEGPEDEGTSDEPPPLEGPDADGTLDDVTDFDAWSVVAGHASLVDAAAVGQRAVRLEADADDDEVRIVRELPEPIDCSGANPGLAVAADETITPIVQLLDEGGNAVDFRTTIHAGDELRRCNFGMTWVGDDADPSEITEIHVAVLAGGDTERELLLDDLHLVDRPDDGLVTVQFAGGHESIHGEAFPILEEDDRSATAFVPTALIRESADHDGDRMTESQLEELADAGWTIASYTANGRLLPDLDPDEQADQLTDAREWLEDEGYGDGTGYLSYPAGQYDETALELARGSYDLGFVGGHPVQGRIVDPLRYPHVVDPDPEDAAALLERTADMGGITALCYYDLESDAADRFEETMAVLDDLVAEGELEVVDPQTLESEYTDERGGE